MHFEDIRKPDVNKPLIIAAMQDMGNVGSIVVNHINKSLGTASFRHATSSRPPYVYDKGCLLYTSPSPRDGLLSRMPSSA